MIQCDYCSGDLPSVKDRAHIPTVPSLQRLGFDREKIVCPECVQVWRVAEAMWEAPDPSDPDSAGPQWPPTHPEDLERWLSWARVAVNAIKES